MVVLYYIYLLGAEPERDQRDRSELKIVSDIYLMQADQI